LKYLLTHIRSETSVSVSAVFMEDNISNMVDLNTDPRRWAFFTQMVSFLRHFKAQSKPTDPCSLIFVEGSLLTDMACTMKRWDSLGYLGPEEKALLHDWYTLMSQRVAYDAVVYLDNDVHSHYERVVNNSKREQAWISREMLVEMKRDYDVRMSMVKNVPTIFISCTPNFEDNEPALIHMASLVTEFIKKNVFKDKKSTSLYLS
jgi:deoxyadenosine/deoxycytidine kinase